jgi:hypothetical protein
LTKWYFHQFWKIKIYLIPHHSDNLLCASNTRAL